RKSPTGSTAWCCRPVRSAGGSRTATGSKRVDFGLRHVMVTGGTGAVGYAVVGALVTAGAHCLVPYLVEKEAQRFPHRGNLQATLIAAGDLSDETAVARLFEVVPELWASIHIAGGFAAAPVEETAKAD